jgi:chromosome segregation ATPase
MAEERANERMAEAQERANTANDEAGKINEKIEDYGSANKPKEQLVANQLSRIEESAKQIQFMQKENKKFKSQNDRVKKELKKAKALSKTLMKANEKAGESLESLSNNTKKLNSNTATLNASIDKYKGSNNKLREDLKSKQAFYNAEAQIRLQYQKTMAQILDVFQDNCQDPDLVEEVVCVALDCESESKAVLAAAEANAGGLL